MDPVTQWVEVRWTKSSRGGAAATVRNAVPTAYALPVASAPLIHDVLASEADGFEPRSAWEAGSIGDRKEGPGRFGTVEVKDDGGALRVKLWPPAHPPRRRRPPAVVLGPGEWLRWIVNYRISGYRGWSYALVTMSLANGPVALDAFVGEPTKTVDERISLF